MSKFTAVVFMPVGSAACLIRRRLFVARNLMILMLFLITCPAFSQSDEETKKEADKLFKSEQYDAAYKLYSQLVANYPKDPEYNYRLGVCMIYSEPDKKKCLPYLKLAAANPKDAPKEVHFYLGKGYHINYRFDEAIKNYNEFKKTAPASLQKKLQVDREISTCANGKHLLSNLTDLVILNKKVLPESDYFRSYDLQKMGKLLVKPDDFKTSADKKRKETSVVFLPANSEVVYYSSYGDDGASGKDIYFSARGPSGSYGKAEKVKGINTEFDEDYPFLHPDGKTLYFASKGHNSMGGYDIFKSVYSDETQSWGKPVNLEFPINSPDDDYLFVTDSIESVAFFSTGRQSPPGKIDVLKVKTERRPIDIVSIKGTVIKGQVDHSLASSISVRDLFSDADLGTFYADEDGNYNLELPNGGKLVFNVETPGMETQSSQVSLPKSNALRPYRQSISYDNGKLKILNYFDEQVNDNSYLSYLNVIEKKARLEVNSKEEGGQQPPAVEPEEKKEIPKPTVQAEEPATAPKQNLNNRELAELARKDALESRQEAAQLQADSKNARSAAEKQKNDAERKLEIANNKITGAEQISDESLRADSVAAATQQKEKAQEDLNISAKILAFSESLSEDAKVKEKEAALNEQYAQELEKAIANKDPQALDRVQELQNQIEELSQQKKQSETLMEELQTTVSDKEKQIADLTSANENIKTSLAEIVKVSAEKETELTTAKKKKQKQLLEAEISDLKSEQKEKEAQLLQNKEKISDLKDELSENKTQLAEATRIKNETKTVPPPASGPASAKELRTRYKDRLIENAGDKFALQQNINELNNYNRDIDASLILARRDLAAAKNPGAKQKFNNEVKDLEAMKKYNQSQISGNFNRAAELTRIEEQNKVPVATTTTYRSIPSDDASQAVTLIDELKIDLQEDDRDIFRGQNLANAQAKEQQQEAKVQLEEALEKERNLLNDLETTKQQVLAMATNTTPPVFTPGELILESEKLAGDAQQLRDQAASATGDEKQRLLSKAARLDEEAQDKNIEAAKVQSSDNTLIVAANKENIQNLLKENKAAERDIETARKLSDEAVVLFVGSPGTELEFAL